MDLEKNIKKWVVLDNQQKDYNSKLKLIRNEKNDIQNSLFHHYNNNSLNYPSIKISDGKLNFVNMKHANVMSYNFLDNCFNEYFENKEQAQDLLNFIKKKRIYNDVTIIKRTYNSS